jgi:hypothetical protein|tara:strand:- start:1320 stop:1721 length:402 start_codon:yes stop_codon:yes gene_type:complete
MKRNSAAVAAVVLALVLGNALAGIGPDIGYHVECTDNIDNNQDGFIDGDDPECVNYPWADGNGESPTQDPGYYQSTDGYEFYSDYVINYVPDPQLQEQLLCAIQTVPDFHQGDSDRASEIIAEYGINCQGQGP